MGIGGNPAHRICLWSGPRNVSTALMYSFAQRGDTRVVDEPLYAHYLRVSGASHPGREKVLAHQDSDGEEVVNEIILGPCSKPVLFIKNMAHHLVDVDWAFLSEVTNVILTRDPVDVLPSLARKLGSVSPADTGYEIQVKLARHLDSAARPAVVLEARQLQSDPPGVLGQLCESIGITYDDSMLHWPAGPRPEDGVWADIWYHDVHMTTGFAPYRPKRTPFPPELLPLLNQCRPLYSELLSRALTGNRVE
ncbi:MAG: sulfotransferase family protein [Acidimicrobiia bacterium]|nr:sulfotransferase family protein [Acidimicrobiia bacterium]